VKTQRRSTEGPFRLVLMVGAVAAVAIGVWGLVWTGMLDSVLGFKVPAGKGLGVIRLFGGVMVSLGVAYALAAAQPQRSRSLLVLLFVSPLMMAVTTIAAVARGEMQSSGKGIGFVIFNLAYCFLYFRFYPRVTAPEAPVEQDVPPPQV
jgi:hypothetical protein